MLRSNAINGFGIAQVAAELEAAREDLAAARMASKLRPNPEDERVWTGEGGSAAAGDPAAASKGRFGEMIADSGVAKSLQTADGAAGPRGRSSRGGDMTVQRLKQVLLLAIGQPCRLFLQPQGLPSPH